MAELSEKERIYLLMMKGYGDKQRSYQETCDLFNATFNARNPISKSTVVRTIYRFLQTDSIKDRPRSGRSKSISNNEESAEILQSFIETPNTSTRKVATEIEISQRSVCNILKRYRFHPYKMHYVQELVYEDFDRRMKFCEFIQARGNDFVNNIVFTDEAVFQLNGNVNRQNFRYWNSENPHWMRDKKSQYLQKVNVWTGIIEDHLIGPFFFNENLNSERYEAMLVEQIIPAIQNIFPNNFDRV